MIGGTLLRGSFVGSSSRISVSGRLLQFRKNAVALSSSASIAPKLITPVVISSCCLSSLARVSLVVSPPSLPHQRPSVPTRSLAFPSASSSASLPRHQSFDAHSLPLPLSSVSLMSSRLAISSSFCGTGLEGLLTTGVRRRHAHNLRGPSYVKASADLRSISQVSNWCWTEGRGVGIMSEAKESKGRRIECYGTSQAGGDDQPTSSSVLPALAPAVSKAKGLAISFCPRCGGATEEKIPVGEHEMRFVCTACGAVHYQNPKMVVGCLVEHEEKVLLCRRNIEPSYGLWTLPAGYMEIGESAAEGAARETLEEACADVQILGLFAHLDIPFIGQSYIIFRARLKHLHFGPGPESLDCALFKLNEIPFESLAFSSIHVALKMYVEDMKAGKLKVHHGVIDKRAGASPSDLKGFVVRDVLSC